jgi:hypothetical protein
MLAFTKEAVHEVVAAKVSQMKTCGHQSYLLYELQLDSKQLDAINRGCGLISKSEPQFSPTMAPVRSVTSERCI